MSDDRPSAGPRWNLPGLGCLGIALAVGFAVGLSAAKLGWLEATMFAGFFGTLAFVLTGMRFRRNRGVVNETIMAIPSEIALSLKAAIERANPPSHLNGAELSMLDADVTELENIAEMLRRQPRTGSDPAVKQRLEELAAKWLDEQSLQDWLTSAEP